MITATELATPVDVLLDFPNRSPSDSGQLICFPVQLDHNLTGNTSLSLAITPAGTSTPHRAQACAHCSPRQYPRAAIANGHFRPEADASSAEDAGQLQVRWRSYT